MGCLGRLWLKPKLFGRLHGHAKAPVKACQGGLTTSKPRWSGGLHSTGSLRIGLVCCTGRGGPASRAGQAKAFGRLHRKAHEVT